MDAAKVLGGWRKGRRRHCLNALLWGLGVKGLIWHNGGLTRVAIGVRKLLVRWCPRELLITVDSTLVARIHSLGCL